MYQHLPRAPARQHGVAAVEFALFAMVLVVLLTVPLFFSRYFMHYTVAQKAARDAAIYVARIPVADMHDHNTAMAAANMAQDMVLAQTVSLRPGGRTNTIDIQVDCDAGPCGDGPPQEIEVHVRMVMYDDFFAKFTTKLIGKTGVRIRATAKTRYVGQ